MDWSSTNLHYIQVLRRGLVVKVHNVDYCGKPALRFKKLEDIYAAENARLRGSVGKCERESPPPVERTLQAPEPENNNFSCHSDDEVVNQSDDNGELTLKQLRDKSKSKKRKLATPSPTSTGAKEVNSYYQSEEDDDLDVPLSYFKPKKAKCKRRCTNRNLFPSPNKPISIKEEVILESEAFTQFRSNLPEITEPVAETAESEFAMYQKSSSPSCSSNTCTVDEPYSGTVTSSEFPNEVEREERAPVVFAEEQQLCTLNEICNDYFDNVEPESFQSASDELAEVNNQDDRCDKKNNDEKLFAFPRTAVVVSDDTLSSLDKTNDEEQQTKTCFTDAANILVSGNCSDNEKQPVNSSTISEERISTQSSPARDVVDQISESQPPGRLLSTRKAISPCSQERLFLAMNSIELTNDLENYKCKENLAFGDHKDSEGSCLVDASTTKNSEVSPQPKQVRVFIGPKQIARRLRTEKRSSPPKGSTEKLSSPPKCSTEKRYSPPAGNLEGPRLSRSLPQLSTGCTSIKRCSESAIAFSQRQMHDIESLASKLMNELKSMKDMVEEKLLFEAYRTVSLKNDADEVTSAIKSATKVEETTRKWLSMMTRDCTRFCKIMKLTQNGATATNNAVHREGRKISFADEAGGMLCHVNYFENTELESDFEKEEDLTLLR